MTALTSEQAFFQELMGRQPRAEFDDMLPPVRISEVKRALDAAARSRQLVTDEMVDAAYRQIEKLAVLKPVEKVRIATREALQAALSRLP